MARRTFHDIEVATIVAERLGFGRFVDVYCRDLKALIASHRLAASDADILIERLTAIAGSVRTGLHRDGADPAGVRAAIHAAEVSGD